MFHQIARIGLEKHINAALRTRRLTVRRRRTDRRRIGRLTFNRRPGHGCPVTDLKCCTPGGGFSPIEEDAGPIEEDAENSGLGVLEVDVVF